MAIEPEALTAELLAEEEPRYLRRQKPVEIRRRRFGRRSWQQFRRWIVVVPATVFGAAAIYIAGHFFMYSPRVVLAHPDQIVVSGNRYVTRTAIVEKFLADRGRSVLRVPLEERRRSLETLPWVEQATVQRVLPNRIRVELTERTAVAYLRMGTDLGLVDGFGVILDRPQDADFHFPVVTGITESMPLEHRRQRMLLYTRFMKELDGAKSGASDLVSEVDLSDGKDVRAILTGVPGLVGSSALDQETLLVHFGENDFGSKFRLLTENFSQWRASTGRVDSVDLRFTQQVVVNPERSTTAARAARGEAGKSR